MDNSESAVIERLTAGVRYAASRRTAEPERLCPHVPVNMNGEHVHESGICGSAHGSHRCRFITHTAEYKCQCFCYGLRWRMVPR